LTGLIGGEQGIVFGAIEGSLRLAQQVKLRPLTITSADPA
jgi:hypothetical protein